VGKASVVVRRMFFCYIVGLIVIVFVIKRKMIAFTGLSVLSIKYNNKHCCLFFVIKENVRQTLSRHRADQT